MRQNATKVRQKSKVVMRQKCDKILRHKCAKIQIMSHQFCLTRTCHLMSTYNTKTWIYSRLLSCARDIYSSPSIIPYILELVKFQYAFWYFLFGILFFWKKFMAEFFSWKKFEYGKNLCVSLIPYPKEAPECPLYGPEGTQGESLLHLEHTFKTYIQNIHLEITFQTYIRITLELHATYPSVYLSTPYILFTFINYIYNLHQNYIRITACPRIGVSPHYNYIQNYIYNLQYNYIQNYIRITPIT